MKFSHHASQPAVVALFLAAAAGAFLLAAQSPPQAQPPSSPRPAPTNLKVLPPNSTGDQVNEIMERWKAGLGMDCAACHAEDREKVDAEGRPLLNFADDSKPAKQTARLMFTMTEEINSKYIARIDGSGQPVTCGSCHRGHMGPLPFAGEVREQLPALPAANSVEKPQ